ncbi:MAG TPA: RNA polymerase sigma factor [Candidatus Hydrogenedens sp.]|nr:RNA polymerase sigma factor [Candidatus Hydrogenedens sp.]HOK09323.1 RNA polymerase sigma factor [Candidatus Hydrogenedens sp.]HOL19816.1 RNA polymerase sigma factor [Candidatus Hydrogenedens sp.]HPP58607.1 RNA polymerase sigma factor [Candidatus Hydrogenedens sp.]
MLNRDNNPISHEISDKKLIEQIKNGDEQAFVTIMNRYYNMVFYACLKRLHNKEIAKEAVQEVFLKVWKNINSCSEETFFTSWLLTITQNHCIDLIRKDKSRRNHEQSMEEIENIDSFLSKHDAIQNKLETEYIYHLIEQLPEPQRFVLKKRLEGWSVQEIAEHLNCPLGTVLSRFSLGKRKIYELMKISNITLKDL